jgi:hypothetical protein
MDDAAVVSALMTGDAAFFFEDEKALAREAARDFQRNTQSHDASPDNEHIIMRIGHAGICENVWSVPRPRSRSKDGAAVANLLLVSICDSDLLIFEREVQCVTYQLAKGSPSLGRSRRAEPGHARLSQVERA